MALRLVGFAAWMVMLVSCATPTGFVDGDQAPQPIKKQFVQLNTRADCVRKRGQWQASTNASVFPKGGYCQLRAADGGKDCTSSKDCQGYCELSFDDPQGARHPRCSAFVPPRWDRCVPGYFEKGEVFGRGECFGEDAEVQ